MSATTKGPMGKMADMKFKKIPLPKGFDKTNEKHLRKLTMQIQEIAAKKDPELKNYSLFRVDDQQGVALLAPLGYEKRDDTNAVKYFAVEPSELNNLKAAVDRIEQNSEYAGYFVVDINTTQRVLTAERMDEKALNAREHFATALGVKPWQIRVESTPEHGWKIRIRKDAAIYVASKYDKAMQEQVEVVGAPGWFFRADPETNVIVVYPGEMPTFPKSIPMPDEVWQEPNPTRTAFGMKLPENGRRTGDMATIDWKESSFCIIGGEPGSGKSVLMNDILAGEIASGVRLAIVDIANKATDYYWCRPWVEPGYWGCESEIQGAGVLNRLVQEMKTGERARAWKQNGWQNWNDIPDWAKERFPIFDVVLDEFASLTNGAALCKSIPNPEKVLPPIFEQTFLNHAKYSIQKQVLDILRIGRAQGYRLILISQTINQSSSLPPTTRDLFGHRIVMDVNPSDSLVTGTFHDPKGMPDVPANVSLDGVSKGVGRAELSGQGPCIFKTFYAGHDGMRDTEVLGRTLAQSVGLPEGIDQDRYFDTLRMHSGDDPIDVNYMNLLTSRIDMPYTDALMTDSILMQLKKGWDESKRLFLASGADDDDREPSRLETEGGFGIDGRDVADHDAPLKGAARAAHASAVEQALAVARRSKAQGM